MINNDFGMNGPHYSCKSNFLCLQIVVLLLKERTRMKGFTVFVFIAMFVVATTRRPEGVGRGAVYADLADFPQFYLLEVGVAVRLVNVLKLCCNVLDNF